VWGAALIGLVVVAYAASVPNGFVWDDDDYVTANAALRSLRGLWQLWAEPGVVPQYYPVTFTSFWVEYRLWGEWAPGFHAINVLLHAANAVLVWRLLERLAVPGAWIAAALFAVHPVHVESVAWITERKNVLSGFWYLAAAWLFVTRVAGREPGARGPAYAGVVALFVLALLSKSVTASLPVALAIALWWREGRVRRSDLVLLVPLLVLGAAAGLLTASMERHRVGAVGPYWEQTFLERCLIAGRALWFYAGKLLWPHPIAFNYERWTIDAKDALQWVWPAAALAVGAGAWLGRTRLGRGPAAAFAFFAVTLAPALGFVNVYPMRYAFVADHFQYLASLGVLALVGAGLTRIAGSRAALASVPLLVALVVLTHRQSLAYRDVTTLWTDTLDKNPRSVLALQNLGTIQYGWGNLPAALALYERARAVEPQQPDVWNSIGLVQARLGRLDAAISSFERVLRIEPAHAEAARNLGSVLAAAGRRDEAIVAYERAVAVAPAMVEAREDVALLLIQAGRLADAEGQLREAIRIAPDAPGPRARLGATLGAQGRGAEALAAWHDAARLAPGAVDVQAGLADAYAAVGDFTRAIEIGERARTLAEAQGRAAVATEIRRRLAVYRAGAPTP
jgi:tetratricopeptide (TPR) repeat protein